MTRNQDFSPETPQEMNILDFSPETPQEMNNSDFPPDFTTQGASGETSQKVSTETSKNR
jgi:hypothetical protein